MDFHPLANIFPLMEGEEFDDLVADIKANKLREPITVYEGKILDGRNRWRACELLGIEPNLKFLNGENPRKYVISENLHRRHLTVRQRAWCAAQEANMKRGGDWTSEHSAKLHEAEISLEDASKMFRVSRRSVASASFIQKEGTEKDKEDAVTEAFSVKEITKRIKLRTPEGKEKKALEDKKRREPGRRLRREKSRINTVIIASQQLVQASEALLGIGEIPDLKERKDDVIKQLRKAYQNIGRFVRQLEGDEDGRD